MTDTTPRIFAGCLSAYNNGHLHGAWIDCNTDSDQIWAEVQEMLKASPASDAEEWLIFDFDNWQGIKIDECESVERLVKLAEMLEKYGLAFGAYCGYQGENATPEDFCSRYIGQYESEEDFAYQLWEESGKVKQLENLGIFYCYIDWEAIAHDLFIDSYHSIDVAYNEVHVFTR